MATDTKDIDNILLLISLVERNPGVAVGKLAQLMGCDEAAVEDYLNRALMCGVPPYLPDDYVGFVRNGDEITLKCAAHMAAPTRLTPTEATSLSLLLEALPDPDGAAKSLAKKIKDTMRADEADAVRLRRIASADKRRFRDATMEDLRDAIAERRKVVIDYYSVARGEMTRRKVSPFALVENAGEWYLAGDCHLRRAERMFRLDRMRSVEITDEGFTPPKRPKYEKLRGREIYAPGEGHVECEIAFEPWTARRVLEALRAERTRTLKDGREVLRLSASGRPWLFRFLLKFADEAELLAPAELRADFRAKLKEMRGRYDS